ncbi:BTAD domain-containing putative transcriptional regulator [Dactylosporangium sp. NPDC048998]|uniref:BTAD domain-containing putative transcriptional regulator n=1 Tax=Dactylosporangium sp. NPDC048998 TaxID=3363976 RepID=UPI00372264F0
MRIWSEAARSAAVGYQAADRAAVARLEHRPDPGVGPPAVRWDRLVLVPGPPSAGAGDTFGVAQALTGPFSRFQAGADVQPVTVALAELAVELRYLAIGLPWQGPAGEAAAATMEDLAGQVAAAGAALAAGAAACVCYAEVQVHDRALLVDLLDLDDAAAGNDGRAVLARMAVADRRLVDTLLGLWPPASDANAGQPGALATDGVRLATGSVYPSAGSGMALDEDGLSRLAAAYHRGPQPPAQGGDETEVGAGDDGPVLAAVLADGGGAGRAGATPVKVEPPRVYVVREDDTLFGIAGRELGDAERWPELYELNRNTKQPDGARLTDPDVIRPGWRLRLPVAMAADGDDPPSGATGDVDPPASTGAATLGGAESQPSPAAPVTDDGTGEGGVVPGWLVHSAVAAGAAALGAAATAAVLTRGGSAPAQPVSAATTLDRRPQAPREPGVLDRSRPLNQRAARPEATTLTGARAAPGPSSADHAKPDPLPSRDRGPDEGPDEGVDAPRDVEVSLDELLEPATDIAVQPADAEAAPQSVVLDDTGPGRGAMSALAGRPAGARWAAGGLGLTGPGALAAARGVLLAAATSTIGGRSGRVVMAAVDAAALLGLADTGLLPAVAAWDIVVSREAALSAVEEALLRRSRRAAEGDRLAVDSEPGEGDGAVGDAAELVLVTEAGDGADRVRLAALLAQGCTLGVRGVLLGPWPDGTTVSVAADGTVTRTVGDDREVAYWLTAGAGRLPVASSRQTLAGLGSGLHKGIRPFADRRPVGGGHPGPADPAGPPPVPLGSLADLAPEPPAQRTEPGAEAATLSTTVSASRSPDGPATPESPQQAPTSPGLTATVQHPQPPAGSPTGPPAPVAPQPDSPPEPAGHDRGEGDARGDPAAVTRTRGGSPDRVRVAVLGQPRIMDPAVDGEPLRAKSLELLTYLIARDGAAGQDAILDDLLPDAPAKKAPHRLHTYVSNLRRVLKHTGGATAGQRRYVELVAKRYVLDRDAYDVDLWQMQAAVAEAATATQPAERVAALRRAVATYEGPLADGAGYEWVEPYREAARRQALDAAEALADALHDKPAEALAVLTAALRHHPHTESLYQAAMRLHAASGDTAAVRALHQQLADQLRGIDAEPGPDTRSLVEQLPTNTSQPMDDNKQHDQHRPLPRRDAA